MSDEHCPSSHTQPLLGLNLLRTQSWLAGGRDPYDAGDDEASQRRITRVYYTMTALNTLAMGTIISINTLFMIDRGLNTFEWNAANAAYSAGMVIFEIPTGVVADTVGRRASYLLSIVVLFLGTVGTLLFAHDLFTFALFNLMFGLGYTFASGALEAWVVDALRHHDFEGELSSVFATNGIVTAVTMLVATTVGALLGSWHLEIPYVLRAVVLIPLGLFVYLRMFDDGYTTRPLTLRNAWPEMKRTAANGVRLGLKNPAIRMLMLGAVFPGAFFLFGWYSWQPYLVQDLGSVAFGSELVWLAGVISAVLMVGTTLGNGLVGRISQMIRRPSHVLMATTAASAMAILVGGALPAFVMPDSPGGFGVALASFWTTMLVFGVSTPVRQGLLNDLIEADERATVLSIDSLISNLGSTVGVLALGAYAQQVTDAGGLGIGYAWTVGAVVIVLAIPFLWAAGRNAGDKDTFGRANG
ncbi:MAG: MFS transporter [Myxococcales bacterium]|nr:MFS transporter [Myxococcales bacterium]